MRQYPILPLRVHGHTLPNAVITFWDNDKTHTRLNALIAARWYLRPTDWRPRAYLPSAEEFLVTAVAGHSAPTEISLPTATWVALLKAAQISVRTRGSEDSLLIYQLISGLLPILRDAKFFVVGTTIAEDLPATPIRKPNRAMCLAMVESINMRPNGDVYQGPASSLVKDSAVRTLLELLWWLHTCHLGMNETLPMVDVVLDCLIHSTKRYGEDWTKPSVWPSTWKSVANEILLGFLESKHFESCASSVLSSESKPSQGFGVVQKTLKLLSQLFSPGNQTATSLHFKNHALVTFQIFKDIDHRSVGEDMESTITDLLVLYMKAGNVATSEAMIAMDIIPFVYSIWTQIHDINTGSDIIPFIDGYVDSIPPETRRSRQPSEYMLQQLQYIHDRPDNLYLLCRILLQDASLCRFEHGPLDVLLKLLRLHPTRSSWVTCLNKLRQWMPEQDSDLLVKRPEEIYKGIADIQEILEIEEDQLEDSNWKERYQRYASFTDEELRLKHLVGKNADQRPKHSGNSSWDTIRDWLHLNKKEEVNGLQGP